MQSVWHGQAEYTIITKDRLQKNTKVNLLEKELAIRTLIHSTTTFHDTLRRATV